ncbi:mannose-specific lectin TAR1-like [Curcuma longa]|uniref:mannose-specific lectin TAR1-like n=1 Tax=Curcuma longa TaxID=136217 RepID=UPI003D9F5BCF
MASLVMLSAAVLLGLLLPSSMADRNVLYGGEKLRTDEFLAEGDYIFVMQSDCNLVLYEKEQALWSSETNGLGSRCFARMQTDGNFIIFNDRANKVWESRTRQTEGEFILVLQRDGHVVIYADPIFTVPEVEPNNRKMATVTNNHILYADDKLNNGESLTKGEFTFIMQSDCNLVLYDNDKEMWSSASNGLGNNCVAHLQTNGDLVILSDNGNVVWSSNTSHQEGEFILVLQRDGKVVIYSRALWNIPKPEPRNRKIAIN